MLPRWLPEGRQFTPEEIVFFRRQETIPLRDALPRFDVLVTGPHATAAIPAELKPFLSRRLTRRKQFDFSDVSTSAIGRRWAQIDSHVLYVENPHPRLVLDPNRRSPSDLEADLRVAFARIRAAGPGQPVNLDGVDAVRPVTFAFEPVLLEPVGQAGWCRLVRQLRNCAARGTDVYTATRDRLLGELLRARCPAALTPMLHVVSLHDTMAAVVRPDGAITNARSPLECLPQLVSVANMGDARGEPPTAAGGVPSGPPVTIAPRELRRIAAAFRVAAGVPPMLGGRFVAMNRVYRGGWETIAAGRQTHCRNWTPLSHGSHSSRIGAYMAEFAREVLLDPLALTTLSSPGTNWPPQEPAHVDRMAQLLKATYQILRGKPAERGVGKKAFVQPDHKVGHNI
jgi:hypothetical protein